MKSVSTVLRAIAAELAATAKQNMPELKEGEKIEKEYLLNGIYVRETSFGNRYQYDFKQKKNQINPFG